jgi:hypothetical protein
MLLLDRPWLKLPKGRDRMVRRLLETTDELFFDDRLGLIMFSAPVANNPRSVRLVGRLGVFPAGCGENGEYHHCQAMMHRARLEVPGQADAVWRQFPAMMSAMRDEGISGPFESPANCYVSDRTDPHFAKGLDFGLSGSVDWIVEVLTKTAGLELALHDRTRPDVRVDPNMPESLGGELRLRRFVHCTPRPGVWRKVPLEVIVQRSGRGPRLVDRKVLINGRPAAEPEVADLRRHPRVKIEITCVYRH